MRDVVSELKVERDDLKTKFKKIDDAIENYQDFGISKSHMELMSSQWVAMKHYIEALDNRIKDLEK